MSVVFIVIRLSLVPLILPIVFLVGAILFMVCLPIAVVIFILGGAFVNDDEADGDEISGAAYSFLFRAFSHCLIVPVIRTVRWARLGGTFDVFNPWDDGYSPKMWG